MSRRLPVLTATAIALILAAALPALAAKGGNGNGGGGKGNDSTTPVTQAWVSASPNQVAPGSRVEVTSCGLDVNYSVELRITHPDGSLENYGVGVWYTGCMNTTPIVETDRGVYTLEVWQRNGNSSSLKASTSMTVG